MIGRCTGGGTKSRSSFAKFKGFRAVATLHDKTNESFAAAVCLVSGVIAAA